MNKPDKDTIAQQIRKYGRRILGNQLLFSAIFGSYAYNGHSQNDVDMVFITRSPLEPRKLDSMKDEYFQLHHEFGLTPDTKFPGEYVPVADLERAETGWGFLFSDRVEIPLLKCGNDWNDFNDYRHHLTAIGGPTLFVDGDGSSFYRHKNQCLKTLMGASLLHNERKSFSLDQIVELIVGRGKDFLGFPDNPRVREYLAETITSLIKKLTANGDVVEEDGKFEFRGRFLRDLNDNIRRYNGK